MRKYPDYWIRMLERYRQKSHKEIREDGYG